MYHKRPAVVIDVTLNKKQHQLIIYEQIPLNGASEQGSSAMHALPELNSEEAMDEFCKKNMLSNDKRVKLQGVVDQQLKIYQSRKKKHQSMFIPGKSWNRSNQNELTQIEEETY